MAIEKIFLIFFFLFLVVNIYFCYLTEDPSFLLIFILIIICGVIYFWEVVKKHRDIFSPIIIFLFSFFLLFIIKPMDMLIFENYLYLHNKYVFLALFYILIGLLSFIAGYYSRIGKILGFSIKAFPSLWNKKKSIIISIFYLGCGLIIWFFLIKFSGFQSYKEVLIFSQVFRAKTASKGVAYLRYCMVNMLIMPLFLYINFLFEKRKIKFYQMFLVFFMLVCLIFLFLPFGIRGLILFLPLQLIIFYHYARRRLRGIHILIIVIIFIFLVVIAVFLGTFRILAPKEKNLGFTYHLLITKMNLYYIYSNFMHRLNAFSTFVSILKASPNYKFGWLNIIGTLTRFIPRALWPGKPLENGSYVTKLLFPKIFEANVSFAPSIFGALYIDFDLPAIIIGLFIFGIFIRGLQQFLENNIKNKAVVLYYCYVFMSPFGFLNNGYNSGIWVNFCFSTIFCLLTFQIIKRQKEIVKGLKFWRQERNIA